MSSSESQVPGVLLWIGSLSLSAPSLPAWVHSILFLPLLSRSQAFLHLSVGCAPFWLGGSATRTVPDFPCLTAARLILSLQPQQLCWQSPETFRWHDSTFLFWFTSQPNGRVTPNLCTSHMSLSDRLFHHTVHAHSFLVYKYSDSVCTQPLSPSLLPPWPLLNYFNKSTTPSCLSRAHRRHLDSFLGPPHGAHSDTDPLSSPSLIAPSVPTSFHLHSTSLSPGSPCLYLDCIVP